MLQLATPRRMHKQEPRRTSFMLRVWTEHSRSSAVSSSRESINLSHRIKEIIGRFTYRARDFFRNMIFYWQACETASSSTYLIYRIHKLHLTQILYLISRMNLKILLPRRQEKADTLVHSQRMHLSSLLGLFRHHRSLSFQSQESQVHKQPHEMWQKPIAPFHFTTHSGQDQWYVQETTSFEWTLVYPSGAHHHQEYMAMLQMPKMIFLDHKGYCRYRNGWMITSLFEFFDRSFSNTTVIAATYIKIQPHENAIMMEDASGMAQNPQPTMSVGSLMKTTLSHAKTYHHLHHEARMRPSTPTTSLTLTPFQVTLAFHGSAARTLPSHLRQHSLAWYGTLRKRQSVSQQRRRRNTNKRSLIGNIKAGIPFSRYKGSTASCYMPAWLFPEDVRISLDWRPCSESALIALSCHTHLPKVSPQIWNGGLPSSARLLQDPYGPYQTATSRSSISEHSQMPVQALALASSSMAGGELGGLSQDGKHWMDAEILDGQRQSDLNLQYAPSPGLAALRAITGYTGTTRALLMDGETAEVGAKPSMPFSKEFISTSPKATIPSAYTQPTYPASTIQQMPHLGVSTHPSPSSSHHSSFHQNSDALLSMLKNPTQLQSYDASERDVIQKRSQSQLRTLSQILVPVNNLTQTTSVTSASTAVSRMTTIDGTQRFSAPLPSSTSAYNTPKPYRVGLTPIPSNLRPHCLARDRLRLWRPLTSRTPKDQQGKPITITDADLDRVLAVITVSWAQGTRETYGAGLLVFHVFCDTRNIPESQRCPAGNVLMLAFIASCAGAYSGKSLANYFYAIKAWHTLHGQPWEMNHAEMNAALDGATKLAPPTSRRPKRHPFTIDFITQLRSKLDITLPLDAAVFACLTTTFFSMARLGEFTLTNSKAFDHQTHVTPSDISTRQDRHGLDVTVFHIPRTKVAAVEGEDVYWATQMGLADPAAALANHLAVNKPPRDGPLFARRHRQGMEPLTRSVFLKRLNIAASALGVESLKGHGIRIGATLEYLLRGVPFDVVKSLGRWSGDSFTLYLRQHAVVMAPYLQGTPILEPFTRYTMPPAR
ncbi:hypothetical protein AcV5_010472 [Taiwanofungus camphoratus]|nr:hypothetical protein AcV5_010472 [Antrodia cinnamomea]